MRHLFFILIVILIVSCNDRDTKLVIPVAPDSTASASATGEDLFNAKCASCHRCEGEFTGPPLKGSASRWNNDKALYDFVRNSQEIIKTNDRAAELYRKYNNAYMTPFPELTDPEIKAILDHCDK